MTSINVEQLDISTEEGQPDVACLVDDFLCNDDTNMGSGEDYGAICVRIGVDGDFDRVQADLRRTGDVEGLDRAIAALTAVRHELAALYAVRPRRHVPQCLRSGGWGRCAGVTGHEGEHDFPPEPMDLATFATAISSAS